MLNSQCLDWQPVALRAGEPNASNGANPVFAPQIRQDGVLEFLEADHRVATAVTVRLLGEAFNLSF